jgi:hypothetical protein
MAIEKVVNIKVNDDVQETTKNVVSLKTQLRQAQNEVNELSARFGATSEQAVNAARRAAELADAIGDARALTDAFNPDAKFKALTATLGGVAGGFSAVQGAVALLGEESENVEKLILKVQSAMAISQGVQAIGESVDSFRQLGAVIRSTTLFQKALSAATAIQTFVMNGATLAAKALRGALIATGVGALVVGVGLLIANFDKVKKVVLNLVPQLAMVGDVVMSIVNAVTDFVGATSEAERANDRLMKSAKNSIALNKKYLAEHGSQLDEFTKQKIAAKDKYNEAIQEENADRVALAKELNRELANIDKARQEESDKKAKEEQDKIDAKNKEARDKRIAKAEEEAKRLDDIKKKQLEADMESAKKALEIVNQLKENNETPAQKEQREYEEKKAILEANNVSTEELDRQHKAVLAQAEMDYWAKESEESKKRQEEKDRIAAEDIAREQKVAEEKRNINNLAIQSAQGVVSIIASLGEKNKKIQKVALIANGALSIAEIINNTNVGSSKEVATKGIFGLTTSAVLYAKMALSIGSVIASTAKGLQALGGGGSVGSGSQGGNNSSGGGQSPAPPQFNIVGQSGTNQLAQTIAGKQNKPIEAFVVSSAVTTSQALDRNRVKTATFGN